MFSIVGASILKLKPLHSEVMKQKLLASGSWSKQLKGSDLGTVASPSTEVFANFFAMPSNFAADFR